MNQKFPKLLRILTSQEFEQLYRQSRRKRLGSVTVALSRLGSSCTSRLGLAVSSKVGSSVRRNLIRRLIKEWFRKDAELRNLNLDFIISVDSTIYSAIKANDQITLRLKQDLSLIKDWILQRKDML